MRLNARIPIIHREGNTFLSRGKTENWGNYSRAIDEAIGQRTCTSDTPYYSEAILKAIYYSEAIDDRGN